MLTEQMWMRFAPELETEWLQCWEEGRDVDAFRLACEDIARRAQNSDLENEADVLAKLLHTAPLRGDFRYQEPSDYQEIRALLEPDRKEIPDSQILRQKIEGAWIGRIAGCLLGKPLEGLRTPDINLILRQTGNYPMERYVDSREFPQELPKMARMDTYQPWQKCWIDTIDGAAPTDDDTNYTVFALKLVEHYGRSFTSDDVLEGWLTWIPMFSTCTAERVAYRNAACGMTAPHTAQHRNPYREWIGAQIRGDFFGYINPGDPEAAAEMAWRDARISHVKNGIYGEMFAAAMIAKAAVCRDPEQIVLAGMQQIPPASRLYEALEGVVADFHAEKRWEQVIEAIHARFDEYLQHDWCHTISNAMIVAAAVLYGEGDFSRSICLAVQPGFDTDCNGATVGSVLGMMGGISAINPKWIEPFRGNLRTGIDGYSFVTVEELTDRTMHLLDEARFEE